MNGNTDGNRQSIFKSIDKSLGACSKPFRLLCPVLLVALTGLLDFRTGYHLGFSIFYLFPVFLATWYSSLAAGVAVSLLSTAAWFIADAAALPHHLADPVMYWNAFIRLGFFLIVSSLGAVLKNTLTLSRRQAAVDFLTGAANTRSFFDVATIEIERSRRYGRPLTAAYVDLDDFKRVNDTLGHVQGDALLRAAADVMRSCLRSIDTIARLGGDEFAVLLPETGPEQARPAIERLRERLAETMRQNDWPVTFSIGVATFLSPPASVDELIRQADALMYKVKNAAKNACEYQVFGENADKRQLDSP